MNKTSEKISTVSINDLHPFPDHPFSVKDDMDMQELTESIKENGILEPITITLTDEGYYEIVSGHRRVHACKLAGITEIPAVIRNLTREEAVITMVDSNLQRSHILPCEKGKAYRMKNEAIRQTAGRPSNNSRQDGENFNESWSITQIANMSKDSERTIQRYIRLTYLKPELQNIVDENKMGLTQAYEISFLKPEEQDWVIEAIESEQTVPSHSQAQRMKNLSSGNNLTEDMVLNILSEQKKPEQQNIVIKSSDIRKFFPKNYTDEQIEIVILKLLESWYKHNLEKKSKINGQDRQKLKSKDQLSL